MKPSERNKLSFERTEEISLPSSDAPARVIYGRDWQTLKRLVTRIDKEPNSWQRRFDLSLATALAFGIAWLTPNEFKLGKVSVRLVFGFAAVGIGFFALAAFLAKRSEKDQRQTNKADLEAWVSDIDGLHSQEYSPASNDEPASFQPSTESAQDELYDTALELAQREGTISTSKLQRRLRIGYGRAARLIDRLEANGVVGEPDGARPRKVLTRKP